MGAVSIIYVPFLILLRTVYDKQVFGEKEVKEILDNF